MTSLSALFAGAFVVAMLAAPRPAGAHEAACWEIWNPHGQTTPPAGSTTLPGPNGGQNEDGFYQVGACSFTEALTCPTGFGPPIFAGECHCESFAVEEAVTLTDGCPNETGGGTGFEYGTFDFGTVIKFIEANGKPPGIEPMAGSKHSDSSPAGDSSDSVEWQLWGQGDLWVCSAVDPSACACCHVPPLPK
jgi:hypothetical protein